MKERRKDEQPEEKLGWYYRHWKRAGLDKVSTKTFSVVEWDQQCKIDPVFNKEPKPPKQKRQKTDP